MSCIGAHENMQWMGRFGGQHKGFTWLRNLDYTDIRLMTEPSAIFVSDLHLGTLYAGADPDRGRKFEEFLRGLSGKSSHLFLLGDIFEFWMEYRHYIPKDHFGILSALKELRLSGMQIHYLCGNHDFNLGTFFKEHLEIETHDEPFQLELQGKRLLLLHGDGMDVEDKIYPWVRKILHHPFCNWLYSLLHPDLGMKIALGVGNFSRNHTGNVPRYLDRYEAAAKRLLQESRVDILMHGHVHAGFVKDQPEGVYVNTGEWLQKLQYVEMIGGQCFLRNYNDSSSRLIDSSFS
ncbi:MAG TPA: hypothetical protein DCQ83_01650 [Fibrobacteres bacterium]|nr:hypothetical protein [Fibrobacterota bacterium]